MAGDPRVPSGAMPKAHFNQLRIGSRMGSRRQPRTASEQRGPARTGTCSWIGIALVCVSLIAGFARPPHAAAQATVVSQSQKQAGQQRPTEIVTVGASDASSSATPMNVSRDIFYHIMPIAWRHAPAAGTAADSVQNKYRFGTFKGIGDSIPYLKSLGVTAIWLNPIFPSPAYHGYQHDAADRLNPWFGNEAEFVAMVKACHGAGIKVFLDLVVYGINKQSIYYKGAVNNPASGYATLLAFTDAGNTKSIGYDFKTWNGDTVGFVNWDLRRTTAKRLVIEWSKRWLMEEHGGIDGYRLDHVWMKYDKGDEGLGYHIDTFWHDWREELETIKPNVFTFAEQQDWTSFGAELLRTSKGERTHDAAFTKPFEFAARDALKEEKADKLYLSMAATLTACPDTFTSMAIIGDHDVDRVASAIGGVTHPGRLRAAAAILMLQPFPPVLYYGDELGMLGVAGSFGSDANDIPRREPMKWAAVAADSAVTSNYYALHERAFKARTSQDNDGTSVQEQDARPDSLLNLYRELAALRHTTPVLGDGEYVAIKTDQPAVWCFAMTRKGSAGVTVAINLSSAAVIAATLPSGPIPGMPDVPARISLTPYGYVVLDAARK